MSHNIYHMSSWATIPEYQPRGDTKALARYVTLEVMWYMYNIKEKKMENISIVNLTIVW